MEKRVMKGRKSWFNVGTAILVVVVIGLLVLMACDGGGGGNGNPRPWVLRYGYPTTGIGSPEGIAPNMANPMVGMHHAEVPLGTDPETRTPEPALATEWEWAENQSYIDLTFRTDVKFHNGDNMTAEDVKFSFDVMQDEELVGPETVYVWSRWIDHVDIIGDYEVRVHMVEGEPIPPRTDIPLQPYIIPKNYIEEVGWEVWAQAPVLTGVMKVADWQADVYVKFEKAFPEEGHWNWGALPNYDELIIWSVVEPTTRLAMLKADELDMAQVPPANIPDVEDDPDLTLAWSMHGKSITIRFYDWANNDSPLSDPDVRRAVSLAIDREAISENVAHGTVSPWGSYWAPYSLGYQYREPDPYDPVEAQSLLDGAGYPDGFTTTFPYAQDRELLAGAVIGSLASAGINAVASPIEPTTWATMLYNDELEGMGYHYMPAWYGRHWPEDVFGDEIFGFGAQVSRDIPEVYDAWNAMVTAEDMVAYEAAAQAAEVLVYDTLGYSIPVFAENFAFGYRPTVEEWEPSAASNYQFLVEVTYKG